MLFQIIPQTSKGQIYRFQDTEHINKPKKYLKKYQM